VSLGWTVVSLIVPVTMLPLASTHAEICK